ncbi:hypothetical protein B7P02_23470 [Bordetella bronchiseptica]|nr:hypothetical protein BTL45_22845 [Bordetella bronchiseptica]AWP60824.1 hypothetical protein B7P02_23470 [Bordetella bronchiseptica]
MPVPAAATRCPSLRRQRGACPRGDRHPAHPAPPHPPHPPHPAHPAHPTFPPASTAEFQPTTGIRTPSCCIQAAINPLRTPKTELFLN